VALWGKNLADNTYEAFVLDNLPQASRAIIWGDGRSYGLDVTYRYF
jgi:iron complex outermembrane receptor protein